tara:strand:- start:14091 stop:15347 length:1257 start_codon:yes stop_codon:yes gene_type:complete
MKQIIFIEAYPEVMIYKMARLFKKKGYKTISIRILESKGLSNKFYNEAFDKIICFNLKFHRASIKSLPKIALSLIKSSKDFFKSILSIFKLNPYVIFCRTSPNRLCAITKILFNKYPLIYFPYDISALGDIRFGGTKGKTINKLPSFEAKAEKYCFENVEGILHKGSPDELKYLNKTRLGKDLKLSNLQISFNPYCSEEFILPINKNKLSKKDKEIHIVTVGSCGATDTGGPNFLIEYAKAFAKQKIHLHVYIRPNISSKKEVEKAFMKDSGKDLDKKYFHWHEPLGPKELIKEISKYDYAIMMINMNIKNPSDFLSIKLLTGNQVASYLEAGLPFFYSKNFEYLDKSMRNYKLDLTYENIKDLENLKKTIKKLNYKKLEKNVQIARQDYLMETQFPRLEKFVKKVVDKNLNKRKRKK